MHSDLPEQTLINVSIAGACSIRSGELMLLNKLIINISDSEKERERHVMGDGKL